MILICFPFFADESLLQLRQPCTFLHIVEVAKTSTHSQVQWKAGVLIYWIVRGTDSRVWWRWCEDEVDDKDDDDHDDDNELIM